MFMPAWQINSSARNLMYRTCKLFGSWDTKWTSSSEHCPEFRFYFLDWMFVAKLRFFCFWAISVNMAFSIVERIDWFCWKVCSVNEFINNLTKFPYLLTLNEIRDGIPKTLMGPFSSHSIQILPGLVWASNRTHMIPNNGDGGVRRLRR